MSRYRVYIDNFTTLDDLPRRKHGNDDVVLAALLAAGRFSVWDISTAKLGSTLTRLIKSGRLIVDADTPYPWTNVRAGADRSEP